MNDKNERWYDNMFSEINNLLVKLNNITFIKYCHMLRTYLILYSVNSLKDAQDKISDFIQYVENYHNNEHYVNIVQESSKCLTLLPQKIFQNILLSLKVQFVQIEEMLLDETFEVFIQYINTLQHKYSVWLQILKLNVFLL